MSTIQKSLSWFLCKNWASLEGILVSVLCKAGTRISLIATLSMKAVTSYQKTQKGRPALPGDKSRANLCTALMQSHSHIPIKDPAVTQPGQIKHNVLKPRCLLWNKTWTSPWQENFLGNFSRFWSKKKGFLFSLWTHVDFHCSILLETKRGQLQNADKCQKVIPDWWGSRRKYKPKQSREMGHTGAIYVRILLIKQQNQVMLREDMSLCCLNFLVLVH